MFVGKGVRNMHINEEDLPGIAATIAAGLVASKGESGINPKGAVKSFFSVLEELERQNGKTAEEETEMKINL